MTLPHEKRFPTAFEFASTRGAELRPLSGATPAAGPVDQISRVASRYGWPVTSDGKRWVVDAGVGRRVLAERLEGTRGPLLRFRCPLAAGQLTADEETELLRKNARTAHAGFSTGTDGRALLVATLADEAVDDDEVDAVLRSIIAGGEGVGARPLDAFNSFTYKTSAEPGLWEKEILFESLGRVDIAFQLAGPHASATVPLDGDRHHTVHLLFDRADAWGDQVVQLISFCAPANPSWHHKALASNLSLAFATIALATFGRQESLVAMRTKLARTTEPEALLASVTALAEVASRVGLELAGEAART